MRADEVFGATFVHVGWWYCTVHHGVADDLDDYCDRQPFRRKKQRPCHFYQLGYHAQSDGLDGAG